MSDKAKLNPAEAAFQDGLNIVKSHPMFARFFGPVSHIPIQKWENAPKDAWCKVTSSGILRFNHRLRGQPREWAWVLAQCLLHLGFGHFKTGNLSRVYVAACDIVAVNFLSNLKIGTRPLDIGAVPVGLGSGSLHSLLNRLRDDGDAFKLALTLSTAGHEATMEYDNTRIIDHSKSEAAFAAGVREAATTAIGVASGEIKSMSDRAKQMTIIRRAWKWFIDHYPLLGGVVAAYDLVEDRDICHRLKIKIAAVDIGLKEIYANPLVTMRFEEWVFVMGHEILHAALRHDKKRMGRDPWIWNAACDFVINGWLIEMGVGQMPAGLLHDLTFKGKSAVEVYNILCTDIRRLRKLSTLRGEGACDIIESDQPWENVDADNFVRMALSRGFDMHFSQERGYLPAGLIEEIRTAMMPPIPWDVELGHWFDRHFRPIQEVRSWRRFSRTQAVTPDIPRPIMIPYDTMKDGRTFGVVIDSSGSMDRSLLGKAIGSVTSYSIAKKVKDIRLVFCDAHAYDEGWVKVSSILNRVRVRGRGGTVLQPGIDLLEADHDFPKNAPIMIITDAQCDHFKIKREHAILIPAGARMSFVPVGEVFRMR